MADPTAVIFDYYGTLADFGKEARERVFDALARNAGLRVVWINRHGAAWPDGIDRPDAEIASLAELAGALRA